MEHGMQTGNNEHSKSPKWLEHQLNTVYKDAYRLFSTAFQLSNKSKNYAN